MNREGGGDSLTMAEGTDPSNPLSSCLRPVAFFLFVLVHRFLELAELVTAILFGDVGYGPGALSCFRSCDLGFSGLAFGIFTHNRCSFGNLCLRSCSTFVATTRSGLARAPSSPKRFDHTPRECGDAMSYTREYTKTSHRAGLSARDSPATTDAHAAA